MNDEEAAGHHTEPADNTETEVSVTASERSGAAAVSESGTATSDAAGASAPGTGTAASATGTGPSTNRYTPERAISDVEGPFTMRRPPPPPSEGSIQFRGYIDSSSRGANGQRGAATASLHGASN
ncbi:hypothetical protein I316_02848 [Kwoniella heveanensis BCC8398]|uniref:Uncharacterized protein n=1 Tax=Kwoniella heveanensis BCC8398 TaxID=1296120 RepID=A0A1B9GW91_9TREE|nr:hypothetical protein I316_02848 [Kwoniella heveanensis BCC8398]